MTHSASPIAAIGSLARHRGLLRQFVLRQVSSRYRGSMLGIVWSLMNPLLMLMVYSFVFVVVFKARWGTDTGPRGEFAVMLFSGLILHGFLAECISRAPGLILENRNLVKKVVFPLELLPVAAVCSALFQLLVSLVVLLLGVLLVYHRVPLTFLYLPLILLPLVMFALGFSWFLASLGTYLRDTAQITGILVAILLFLSTIFYPADHLPAPADALIYLNPLSFAADELRAVALLGMAPHWAALALYSVLATLTAIIGFAWFQKTRAGFADVV